MAKIGIKWNEGRLSEPGQGEQSIREILALQAPARPILLYLETGLGEYASTTKRIQNTVLKDERVQIGARLFTLVKMPWSRADERLTKLVGRRDRPTLAVFLKNGVRVGSLQTKLSPSRLYGLMKRAAKRDYKGLSIDALIKKEQKILTGLDKIDSQRKTLAAAATKKKTAALQRQIAAKRANLAKEEAELNKRESELWSKAHSRLTVTTKAQ